ncbi:MAG TPA: ABC transporter permease [Blastocatellia bacterium]|jgi:putative ABC transport system permease protein|nr:ABC transporter permease [Blastocatellia bacterium]
MDILLQDLRYGFRKIIGQPGFTNIVLITLALGIGANTAIFSVVNAVLIRQLPFKEPEQLVSVWSNRTDRDKAPFSIPDFIDYRDQNRVMQEMAAYADWSVNLTGEDKPERIQGVRISPNVFQMLGLNATAGRTLLPEDEKANSPRVVVLCHGLWKRLFGADQRVIGKSLILNNDSYTVVGVLPPDFSFPGTKAELGVPLIMELDPWGKFRATNFIKVIGRLREGVTETDAQADLSIIARHLKQLYPDTNERKTAVKVIPLRTEIVGDYQMALWVLLGAIGFVFLIGCLNLINLLLAKASSRHKEIALRTALGASQRRLAQQLLTETMMLALSGGALGFLLAWYATNLLIGFVPSDLPRSHEIGIDARVFLFTLTLSLFAGVILGLIPVLQTSKTNLSEDLKEGKGGSLYNPGRGRTRNLLVILEVAISLVLLIGAGLLVRSFLRIQEVHPGFNSENLLAVQLALPKTKYTQRLVVTNFFNEVERRIETLPGVESAAAISLLPLSGLNARVDFTIEGRPPLSREEMPTAQYRMVTSGYFRTMGVPMLSGREFTEGDTPQSQAVAVIGQALAERYFPAENPIGLHLNVDDGTPGNPRTIEIVGIVGNVKHFGLDGPPTFDLYVPIPQIPEPSVVWLTNNVSLVVRSASDPLVLSTAVRREVEAVDKDIPASSVKSMNQLLSASVAPRRFNLSLVMIFAAAALLLAALGIYGVTSYSVTQRTFEIGIRLAVGAQRGDIFKLILFQVFRLVAAGVAIGLFGSFILTQIIASLLFGVSAYDPSTFATTSLLLIVVALLASYLPARRATKIDPITSLRTG